MFYLSQIFQSWRAAWYSRVGDSIHVHSVRLQEGRPIDKGKLFSKTYSATLCSFR